MAKRKREIKKRKKLIENAQTDENLNRMGTAGDSGSTVSADLSESTTAKLPGDDSQNKASQPSSASPKRTVRGKDRSYSKPEAAEKPDSWYASNKENLLLGLLILYVLLLGLGTVGELFEIEWILNLRLFR